jgi:hypothetical protein
MAEVIRGPGIGLESNAETETRAKELTLDQMMSAFFAGFRAQGAHFRIATDRLADDELFQSDQSPRADLFSCLSAQR